ncbi:MAG TPA: ORF6N domain-containing protein, partial [Nitrospiria bacterium]|nr:ORF6N domain-containing protein [Nitrospiria bacterium]
MANRKRVVIPTERIEGQIVLVRGQKVMLDADLAVLYDVQVKALNQAVRRNIERFPEDFMFQLTAEEITRLRSQTVTLKTGDPARMGFDANASGLRSQIVTSNADDRS